MLTTGVLFLLCSVLSASGKKVMVVTSSDEFQDDPKVLEIYDFSSKRWKSIDKTNAPAPLTASYRAESLKPGTARLVENHAVLEYELKNGLSLELARYPDDVIGSSTLEYGDTLCIVGGYDVSKRLLRNDVLCWNPLNHRKTIKDSGEKVRADLSTGSWVALPPMTSGRHQPGAVVMEGKLYVAGGYDAEKHEFLSMVEVFDDVTQRWYRMSPMKHARAGLRLVSTGGKLYAIGGWRKRNYLTTTEEYDPFTDTWREMADMSVPRAEFGAIVMNGDIYVVGGKNGFLNKNGLKSMEKFSVSENKWTNEGLPDMTRIQGPALATLVNDLS